MDKYAHIHIYFGRIALCHIFPILEANKPLMCYVQAATKLNKKHQDFLAASGI
jgi:hypothetical protein